MPTKPKAARVTEVDTSEDDFTYITEAGATLTFPSLKKAFKNAGELRRMRNASPVDVVFYVIERDLDEDALAAFDEIPPEELRDKLVPQWGKHSGVDLGESKAS